MRTLPAILLSCLTASAATTFQSAQFGIPIGTNGCTAPSISGQPQNWTGITNQSPTFTVTASGTDLTYQWQSNAVDIVNGTDYSGAHLATLTANNVMLTNNFRVIITNACGSITSSVATLNPTNGAPGGPTLWYAQATYTVDVSNPFQYQGIHNTSASPLNIVKLVLFASGGGTPQTSKMKLVNWAEDTQYGSDSDEQVIPASGTSIAFNFSPAITIPAGTDFKVGTKETAGQVFWAADNSTDFSPYNWDGNNFRTLVLEIWIQ